MVFGINGHLNVENIFWVAHVRSKFGRHLLFIFKKSRIDTLVSQNNGIFWVENVKIDTAVKSVDHNFYGVTNIVQIRTVGGVRFRVRIPRRCREGINDPVNPFGRHRDIRGMIQLEIRHHISDAIYNIAPYENFAVRFVFGHKKYIFVLEVVGEQQLFEKRGNGHAPFTLVVSHHIAVALGIIHFSGFVGGDGIGIFF